MGAEGKRGYKVSSAYIRNAFVLFVLPLHLLVILGIRPIESGESLSYTETEQIWPRKLKRTGKSVYPWGRSWTLGYRY